MSVDNSYVHRIDYYVFRQLKRNEEVKLITTEKYRGSKLVSITTKVKLRDTTPQRLSPVKPSDGKEYSDYGGIVLAVRSLGSRKYYGVSVCSLSDKFDFYKGMNMAFDRLFDEYNCPYIPKDCEQIIKSILAGSVKYIPFRTVIYD